GSAWRIGSGKGRASSGVRGGTAEATRGTGETVADWPDGRAGFIGMPKSSGASGILRSSVSVRLRPNMGGIPHRLAAEKDVLEIFRRRRPPDRAAPGAR